MQPSISSCIYIPYVGNETTDEMTKRKFIFHIKCLFFENYNLENTKIILDDIFVQDLAYETIALGIPKAEKQTLIGTNVSKEVSHLELEKTKIRNDPPHFSATNSCLPGLMAWS